MTELCREVRAEGYVHEAFVFDDDEHLLSVVVPFIAEGVAERQPVVVAATPAIEALLRRHVGEEGVEYVTKERLTPASALQTYQKLFRAFADSGAECVRVVGDVPHPGTGAVWDNWARYEAAANRAYAEYPVRGLCLYDRRITPAQVLDDVARTHPRLVVDGEVVDNPDFEDPARFFARDRPYRPDPMEERPPDREAEVSSSAEARRLVAGLGGGADLAEDEEEGLVSAISEIATNALHHGAPPVTVRVWCADDRVVAIVRDEGDGPDETYLGLAPLDRAPGEGGFGLWLAHLLVADVTTRRHDGGFEVRLVAGRPFVGS